jgi:hypothetical protein
MTEGSCIVRWQPEGARASSVIGEEYCSSIFRSIGLAGIGISIARHLVVQASALERVMV